MSFLDSIIEIYPELTQKDFAPEGSIGLRDDSDGLGVYIVKWEYTKPLPEGFKLGK